VQSHGKGQVGRKASAPLQRAEVDEPRVANRVLFVGVFFRILWSVLEEEVLWRREGEFNDYSVYYHRDTCGLLVPISPSVCLSVCLPLSTTPTWAQ
jgi:hypothetical protein